MTSSLVQITDTETKCFLSAARKQEARALRKTREAGILIMDGNMFWTIKNCLEVMRRSCGINLPDCVHIDPPTDPWDEGQNGECTNWEDSM